MKIWTLIILINGNFIHYGTPFTDKAKCLEMSKHLEKNVNPGDSFDTHCFEDRIELKKK